MYERLEPCGSFAVMYPAGGEVRTESLAEAFFRLLEVLDGATPFPDAIDSLQIPSAQAAEFLEFAVHEGFVTMVAPCQSQPCVS
jgi:hypothetical protein